MGTVKSEAKAQGHDYRFYGDEIFNSLPRWYLDACNDHKCPVSDLAQPLTAKLLLSRSGYTHVRHVSPISRRKKLFGNTPRMIAGVGWSLHGRAASKWILSTVGAPLEPSGFYFMTQRDRRPRSETGLPRLWRTAIPPANSSI